MSQALIYARKLLRAKQQDYEHLFITKPKMQLTTQATLNELEKISKYEFCIDLNMVKRGAYKYYRELEDLRIKQAQSIIRRIDPGPFEDPIYLAILAFQAASIEVGYESLLKEAPKKDIFLKFLLGTVPAQNVYAFSEKATIDGFTNIMIYSATIDFIYQAAKVVVEACNPTRTVGGKSATNADFDLDNIRKRLVTDQRPVSRLYKTLEAYFFYGYPRASFDESIPNAFFPMLGMIVAMAERWIIGHEYGHGILTIPEQVPEGVNIQRSEEYFADAQAMIGTVYSAGYLDLVPPEVPLAGAVFVLASLDILQESLFILKTGKKEGFESGDKTHPPNRSRADVLVDRFRQFFDVKYYPDGKFELTFILRNEIPREHNFSNEISWRAYAIANVLLTVWESVKMRLFEDFNNKRPLHEMWCQTDS